VHLSNQQNFLITIVLAMCLRIAPVPYPISMVTPDWILLVLIYWALMLPYRKGVFNAWIIGLFTDVLLGRTLGEYALIYSLVGYFSIKFHKRLRFVPLIQQSVFIFACLLMAQAFVFIMETIQRPTNFTSVFWLPVITGTLIWSFIPPVLHFIRSIGRSIS
jgi:rod shape-determining protein MreD